MGCGSSPFPESLLAVLAYEKRLLMRVSSNEWLMPVEAGGYANAMSRKKASTHVGRLPFLDFGNDVSVVMRHSD